MIYETSTTLPPGEVLRRAKDFFSTRVPATGAFLERESAAHVAFRGQGGEEIVIAAAPAASGSTVRGSTLLFDQQVRRFLSTLDEAPPGTVTP
ncbi:MAG TPA: hypothetical protein VMF70_00610 [Gemmatimonadales bacterium]|nr:hypothetical protein [Gemmatimonadales bacterium]